MVAVRVTFRTPGTYNITTKETGTLISEGIGAGGASGTGNVSGGGGGKGGAYARKNATAYTNGQAVVVVVPAGPTAGAGQPATVSLGGVAQIRAAGGNAGGNSGGLLNPGAAATAQNGALTGDVTFQGGNGGAGALTNGGGGGGGASPTAAGPAADQPGTIQFDTTPTGAGGPGGALANAGTAGAAYGGGGGGSSAAGGKGAARITLDSGTGNTVHTATKAMSFVFFKEAVTEQVALFSKLLTFSRVSSSSVASNANSFRSIGLPRSSSTAHSANRPTFAFSFFKSADSTHTPTHNKFIVLVNKTAILTHIAEFSRLVTVRRAFSSLISSSGTVSKRVGLPRTSSIVSVALTPTKFIRVFRSADTSLVADTVKKVVLLIRSAITIHNAIFVRRVTVRRAFTSSVSHLGKLFVALEARLIPRGDGAVINVIKKTFNILE